MNDIVNLIINSSTSVVVIAYFIFRDYKWNNQLIQTLTKIETLLESLISYAMNKGLALPEDHNVLLNKLLEALRIDSYEPSQEPVSEELEEILTRHPDAEFVQLQINYADWDNPGVASKTNFDICRYVIQYCSVDSCTGTNAF